MSAVARMSEYFCNHPLTRDAPMRAWERFALWQIRSRFQEEIVVPWIEGQRLAVRRGMTGATGNIYVGLHEFSDMLVLLHFLRQDDVFLDIGANVGSYTVLAAGVRGARVWAFEPGSETVGAFNRNIELNDLAGRVVLQQMALGEHDGVVSFTRGRDTVNRVATFDDGDVQEVPIRRLDSLIGECSPIMIKMDVEGHEEAVIRGARNVLSSDHLKVVEIETLTAQIEATFAEYGFRRALYNPFTRLLKPFTEEGGKPSAVNALFVKDWDFVAARLISGPAVRVLGRSI
ncbi:MAG: FkbM family methyltransferase [Hyphomicrobium sp.]